MQQLSPFILAVLSQCYIFNFWLLPKETGELFGDPFEVSTIRREDYSLNKCKGEYVDVIQCNNLPSSRTPRGHQFPGAFLNLVSPPFFPSRTDDPPFPMGLPLGSISKRSIMDQRKKMRLQTKLNSLFYSSC